MAGNNPATGLVPYQAVSQKVIDHCVANRKTICPLLNDETIKGMIQIFNKPDESFQFLLQKENERQQYAFAGKNLLAENKRWTDEVNALRQQVAQLQQRPIGGPGFMDSLPKLADHIRKYGWPTPEQYNTVPPADRAVYDALIRLPEGSPDEQRAYEEEYVRRLGLTELGMKKRETILSNAKADVRKTVQAVLTVLDDRVTAYRKAQYEYRAKEMFFDKLKTQFEAEQKAEDDARRAKVQAKLLASEKKGLKAENEKQRADFTKSLTGATIPALTAPPANNLINFSGMQLE